MSEFDPLSEIERVLTLEGNSILDFSKRTQEPQQKKQIETAFQIFKNSLLRGGKIVVTGVGKSGKIAQKIAATLSSTGSLSIFIHPTEGLHGDLGTLRSQDAVWALSYSGNTQELLALLPSLQELGVPIVGTGGNSKSQLAQICQAWIDGRVENEACPHGLAPTCSTTLMLAIGDAMAIALMKDRGFDQEAFAQNHPGGSIGKRLSLKVHQLMHSEVPIISPEDSMEEVIHLSTKFKLGGVLVIHEGQLVGLITDGDIRRSLKKGEEFFKLKAKQIMTADPITVEPDTHALNALHLMENRESQISVLPVVDQNGLWKGLLRLHDLVRTL